MFETIVSLYSYFDMIVRFRQDIGFSNTGHEEYVILEACSETERANMAIRGGLSTPWFYFHLPIIHELEVFIPFTPFEENFMVTANVTPS